MGETAGIINHDFAHRPTIPPLPPNGRIYEQRVSQSNVMPTFVGIQAFGFPSARELRTYLGETPHDSN